MAILLPSLSQSGLVVQLAISLPESSIRLAQMAKRTQREQGQVGRSKGAKSQGYWFRANRGWMRSDTNSPLLGSDGKQIKDRNASPSYLRECLLAGESCKPVRQAKGDGLTCTELVKSFLKTTARTSSPSTLALRRSVLFDFCTGFAPKHLATFEAGKTPPESERIHKGYGALPVAKLNSEDVEDWLASHKTWNAGGQRQALQSLRRLLNWALRDDKIAKVPCRFKLPPAGSRDTVFTPELEAEFLSHCSPDFAEVCRFLVLSGARPGCEFCIATAANVRQDSGRIKLYWQNGSKVKGKKRDVKCPSSLNSYVLASLAVAGDGFLFRQASGQPWTMARLKRCFAKAKRATAKAGFAKEIAGCSLYSFRHSFAKRLFSKGFSVQQVAGLMGNSAKVCAEVYGKWSEEFEGALWEALEDRQEIRLATA